MELKPYKANAKKHPKDQLAKIAASIQRFGFRQPVVVDGNGTIIVGHGRYEAARSLGWRETENKAFSAKGEKVIPFVMADDLTPEEIAAYRLADNKLNESEWDMELVGVELETLPEELKLLTGFEDVLKMATEEDDFDTTPPEEPKTKLGDLYVMGDHRLLCGDSTSIADVERLMDGSTADMVFTDPPYGVSYQSNMRVKTERFDILKNDDQFVVDWLPLVSVFSKGFVFIWSSWKVIGRWMEETKMLGDITNVIVWDKGGGGMGDLEKSFSTDFEMALVWNRGRKLEGKRIGSVWSVGKDSSMSYQHPTQKPVELAATAIESTTLRGELVLDLFGGSGSTMIACEQTGRRCDMMEFEPGYCDVIVSRWEKLTGKTAVLSTN